MRTGFFCVVYLDSKKDDICGFGVLTSMNVNSWMISLKMLFCVTVAMIQESEEMAFIDSHIEFITFNPSPITFYLAHYNEVVCFVGFDLKIYCKDLLLRVSTCNDRGTVTLLTDSTSYNRVTV